MDKNLNLTNLDNVILHYPLCDGFTNALFINKKGEILTDKIDILSTIKKDLTSKYKKLVFIDDIKSNIIINKFLTINYSAELSLILDEKDNFTQKIIIKNLKIIANYKDNLNNIKHLMFNGKI